MSLYTLGKKIAGAGATILASALQDGLMAKEDKAILDAASNPVTYTPTITAGSGTFTTVSATGRYIKIGKKVTVFFEVAITTAGTAAGSIIVSLPFTPNTYCHGIAREANGIMCSIQGGAGVSTAAVYKYDGTTIIATGRTVRGTITYFTE